MPSLGLGLGLGLMKAGGAGSLSPANVYAEADAASLLNEANSIGQWLSANSTFAVDSTNVHHGSYALSHIAIGGGGRAWLDLDLLGLDEGATYAYSMWARHTGSGNDNRLGFGTASTNSDSPIVVDLTNTDTTYTEYTGTFTYSAAAVHFLVMREVSATNDGGIILDAISFIKQ